MSTIQPRALIFPIKLPLFIQLWAAAQCAVRVRVWLHYANDFRLETFTSFYLFSRSTFSDLRIWYFYIQLIYDGTMLNSLSTKSSLTVCIKSNENPFKEFYFQFRLILNIMTNISESQTYNSYFVHPINWHMTCSQSYLYTKIQQTSNWNTQRELYNYQISRQRRKTYFQIRRNIHHNHLNVTKCIASLNCFHIIRHHA